MNADNSWEDSLPECTSNLPGDLTYEVTLSSGSSVLTYDSGEHTIATSADVQESGNYMAMLFCTDQLG